MAISPHWWVMFWNLKRFPPVLKTSINQSVSGWVQIIILDGWHWNWAIGSLWSDFSPTLWFPPAAEDTFLSAIINYTNSSTVHFKLSPTYVLYMACRYVLSPSYRPDMSPSERTHKVIAIVNKMVSMMEGVIQVSSILLWFLWPQSRRDPFCLWLPSVCLHLFVEPILHTLTYAQKETPCVRVVLWFTTRWRSSYKLIRFHFLWGTPECSRLILKLPLPSYLDDTSWTKAVPIRY